MVTKPEEIKQFSRDILDFLDNENIHYLDDLKERVGRGYDFGVNRIVLEKSYLNDRLDLAYYDSDRNCPLRVKFSNSGFAEIILRSEGTIIGYSALGPDFKDLIKTKRVDSWIYIVKKELEKLC